MLPLPYRKEALENFSVKSDRRVDSAVFALKHGFVWDDTPQEHRYWQDVCDGIESGYICLSPIPWPETAQWENAPEWAEFRYINEAGACIFGGVVPQYGEFELKTITVDVINPEGIDWTTTLEYRPNL